MQVLQFVLQSRDGATKYDLKEVSITDRKGEKEYVGVQDRKKCGFEYEGSSKSLEECKMAKRNFTFMFTSKLPVPREIDRMGGGDSVEPHSLYGTLTPIFFVSLHFLCLPKENEAKERAAQILRREWQWFAALFFPSSPQTGSDIGKNGRFVYPAALSAQAPGQLTGSSLCVIARFDRAIQKR